MPQFPFRNPVYATADGDPPEQEWKPPDYFQAKESDTKWTPPDYFKIKGKEEPKPSVFSRISKAAGDIGKNLKQDLGEAWQKVSEPLTDAPTRFAESVSKHVRGDESSPIRNYGSAYIEGLGHAVSGLSSPLNLGMAAVSGGASLAEKAGAGEIASALNTGNRVLSAPVAAEGAKHTYEGVKEGDKAKFLSGVLEAGLGTLGMRGSPSESSSEPPIRQSREIPYRMDDSVQEVPKETVSEPIAEKEIAVKQSEKPKFVNPFEKPQAQAENIQRNAPYGEGSIMPSESIPTERRNVEWQPPEYAEPIKQSVEEGDKVLPVRSPNLAAEHFPPSDEAAVGSKYQAPKPIEDILYDIAREKFNMGKDLPQRAEEKPTATFKGMQETGDPDNPTVALYDIKGGKFDKSTVSAERLKSEGIDIPPSTQERMSGDQLRAKAIADRAASNVKIPELVSEGAPPIRQKTGNFWIDDANRMEDEALSRRSDPVRAAEDKAKIDKWEDTQENLRVTNEIEKRISKDKLDAMSDDEFKALHSQIKEERRQSGTNKPEIIFERAKNSSGKAWKVPEYFNSVEKGQVQLGQKQEPIIEHPLINPKTGEAGTPKSIHPDLTSLKNHGDGIVTLDFASAKEPMKPEDVQKLFPEAEVTDLSSSALPNNFRLDFKNPEAADNVEKSVGGAFDKNDTVEMHGGLGGIKPSSRPLEPTKGPYGAALDKLFNAMGSIKEKRVQQDIINKTERAKRFAAFGSVKEEGAIGASKSLSALKGEFDKINVDKLKMTKPQVDSLFTAVKRANITSGEKARGYTSLFKILNGEGLPQRNELAILDNVFGNGFADKMMELHGGIGAVGLKLSKLANTMKSMQNSISLAAPLRHGIGLVARKEFYPAFADMFKFFGNKEFFDTSMQALEERPNYLLGRKSGLFIAKPNSLMNSEEEFLNSYIGQIPGVRNVVGASQRAYTGFLNKLRSDTFDSMIKQAKSLGYEPSTSVGNEIIPSKETKAIANFINNATGRGSLGPLNKMTNELNLLLWSPRMISSRINMLANPSIYTSLPKGMRLEGLKSLLGIAALGTTIDTLAAYGGAKISSNILSTDAGKSRFGKQLIDPWGGFQQYIVGAARFLAGKTDSSMPTNRLEIAGRFMANKESPAASLAHTLLTAKMTGQGNITTQYGEKTNIQSQIAKQFTPIFVQDLQDLLQSDPEFSRSVGLDTALGAASLAGMEQDYPEKKKLGLRKMKLK